MTPTRYVRRLLGIFTRTVLAFYKERSGGESGVVAVVQRTQSDLRLNPHVHAVFVDGGFAAVGSEVRFAALGHLRTREVGEVLERATSRMRRYLEKRGLLRESDAEQSEDEGDASREARGHEALCDSAASGASPPAGPQWKKREERRPLAPVPVTETVFSGACCASKDGFTLHAATCACAEDAGGRERLLRYVLRPAVAQERLTKTEEGLVRIALKRPWSDGTVAVEMTRFVIPDGWRPLEPALSPRGERASAAAAHGAVRRRAGEREQAALAGGADAGRAASRALRERQGVQAEEPLSAVGGAHDADDEARRPRVSALPRSPEAPRPGDGPRRGAAVREGDG